MTRRNDQREWSEEGRGDPPGSEDLSVPIGVSSSDVK